MIKLLVFLAQAGAEEFATSPIGALQAVMSCRSRLANSLCHMNMDDSVSRKSCYAELFPRKSDAGQVQRTYSNQTNTQNRVFSEGIEHQDVVPEKHSPHDSLPPPSDRIRRLFRGKRRILVVGDGDLSFCGNLVVWASELQLDSLLCTVYEGKDEFMQKYGTNPRVLDMITHEGLFNTKHIADQHEQMFEAKFEIIFGIDATRPLGEQAAKWGHQKFDLAVWNFPYMVVECSLRGCRASGAPYRKGLNRQRRKQQSKKGQKSMQETLSLFAQSVQPVLAPRGELWISMKEKQYHTWNVSAVVLDAGLCWKGEESFILSDWPLYVPVLVPTPYMNSAPAVFSKNTIIYMWTKPCDTTELQILSNELSNATVW
eukprot:gnl/TRDRNA2_/TRDRNA2_95720_c0_seq1.p1 gnl/TRDRNA2_/TRDRNA2_95720_c0~~gnl/TRDRNA2_/TRDRNA2_95720_c0_seq1.p1  ORF type:complete len:371 (-),score=26.46 gnl/TRDRNA2_/TRDRNA2_95720_c0_seq1:25-1137(-)